MRKVMIAEDDLMIADILEDVLIHNGYEVCGIARTVKEGVKIGKQCKPDLAVLDMRLAEGGFGTEIAAQLSRQNGLGILYAIGNADRASLSKADGDACLRKPYRPEDVICALKIVEQIVCTGEAAKPFPKGFHVLSGTPNDKVTDFEWAKAKSQIKRLQRQQAELASFGMFALHEHSLANILTEAVRICAECLDVPFCKISRYRVEENDLLVEAGIGWKPEVIGRGSARADVTTPQGRAFITGAPVICGNLGEDSSFLLPPFYAENGIISTFNVIISREDEAPYGVLGIDSPVQNDYDEHDIAFLTGFANVVAEAVGTSKRIAEMLRAVDRMRYMVADRDRLLAVKNVLLIEKCALGEELQHRVRNNLQLVYGMLSKQLQITTDSAGREGLNAIARRVITLAKVYDYFLDLGLSRTIALDRYLSSLCSDFAGIEIAGHPHIALTCQLEPVNLDLDSATALGIIVSELIANTYSHAFPCGTGAISVSLRQDEAGQEATLTFADDGVGFVDPGSSNRHGLGLVKRLMQQVGGVATVRSDHGSKWTLKFPVPTKPP